MNLDPDACQESAGGPGHTQVDEMDDSFADDVATFLRFDLDDALVGADIVAVRLQLTVASVSTAAGTETGDVWRSAPFDQPDLSSTFPELEMFLAPSQGPVDPDQVFEWEIPVEEVQPSASTFLAIVPISTDGVTYWDETGREPPMLFVDALQ
jgi:hypothetical protein